MHSPMANTSPNPNPSITMLRDYRKGNWTLQETMVLIEAKKMDEERRTKTQSGVKTGGGELRWKWVEDYCWRKGCFRSQNQCNDKWDNLMRDFKRVRDYERRLTSSADQESSSEELKSYWEIDKGERKERILPSNMIKQVYDALVDVVERRSGGLKTSGTISNVNTVEAQALAQTNLLQPMLNVNMAHVEVEARAQSESVLQHPVSNVSMAQVQAQTRAIFLQHMTNVGLTQAQAQAQAQTTQSGANLLQPLSNVAALPPHQPLHLTGPPLVVASEQRQCHMSLLTTECDTSEHSDSPSRKRKKAGEKEADGATTSTTNTNTNNISTEISKSAYLITEAIQACDHRQETRHREILSLHQKSLQIEESKAEVTKQGVNGLVDAINNLANSILALANSKYNQ